MRQEEGGSAIEASKIAVHATMNQTGDCTIVQLKRQEELTRAIQGRRETATAEKRPSLKQREYYMRIGSARAPAGNLNRFAGILVENCFSKFGDFFVDGG
jgi:hypothetical protein